MIYRLEFNNSDKPLYVDKVSKLKDREVINILRTFYGHTLKEISKVRKEDNQIVYNVFSNRLIEL